MQQNLALLANAIAGFFIPKIYRAAEHRWARAVQTGLLTCLPLIILGASAILINHLPLEAYQNTMQYLFGPSWKNIPELIWQATFGIIALAMTAAISHALASIHHASHKDTAAPALAAGVSLACFFALIHQETPAGIIEMMGNRGAFAAICNALISAEVFLWLKNRRITRSHGLGHDADPVLPQALGALVPGIITITLMLGLGQLWHSLSALLGHQLDVLLQLPFANPDNLGSSAIALLFMIHLLWFFGVHGNITMDPLSNAHFSAAKGAAGGWVPPEVFSKTFYDVFIYQGGTGCTLALLIAVLLVKRHSSSQRIAKVALPCALINVNEPVLFGFPVVLNPFYLIPFLLTPLILFTSGLFAISLGLVPPPTVAVEWTTPPLLGGWIATQSWRGAALQLINLALATLIYLPFVRMAAKARKIQNAQVFNSLVQTVCTGHQQAATCMQHHGQQGNLARLLAADLVEATRNGQLYLVYQPQTDYAGKASGIEALLRWRHPVYGQIPPILAVCLAEQNGHIQELGRWVIGEACRQLGEWNRAGITQKNMSINLSPHQLSDQSLAVFIGEAIRANQISAADIKLEITETSAIENEAEARTLLDQITALGVRLSLDDFGMGYSSILYLRQFSISTIKIDGTLTRDVIDNAHCQEIIMSITRLCRTTQIEVVAEYVETREQLKVLYGLGCQAYQGYLFSQPLTHEACAAYLREH